MSETKDQVKPDPNQTSPGGNNAPEKRKDGLLTIEEHQKNLSVSPPVFAAVMESNKWASGKRVPVAVFEKAVKDFLGAPMGGK